MGIYIYTLRKRVVNVEGEFIPVMTFDYAYKVSYVNWFRKDDDGRSYRLVVANAERTSRAAWEAAGRKPTLAVWGDQLWLITHPCWNDGDDGPGIKIGNLVKVQGRWHCVAQETLVELALASLG